MGEPIRVLQVFARMNRGGAETMIMNLYRNIDRSKVQFDFIVHTQEKCDYDDEIQSLGGIIYRIPQYKVRNHIQYKKAWNSFFAKNKEYKVMHGHVRSTASIYLKIAHHYGLVTIAHSHSISSGKGIPSLIKNILQYSIRFNSDYLFACSINAGVWLFGKRACANKKFFLLKNAINCKKFIYNQAIRNSIRQKYNIEDKFVIGHVGRFHIAKNHDFLIDVFHKVIKEQPNAVLMLVGDGERRKHIEDKISKLRIKDKVIMTGVRSDVSDLMQAMDIFVFPSLFEGLGIVIIEAQAAGLSCVISENIPEEVIITNLVTPVSLKEHTDVWADKLIQNKILYSRHNTYEQIVNNGYDVSQTSIWLEDFYNKIIKREYKGDRV